MHVNSFFEVTFCSTCIKRGGGGGGVGILHILRVVSLQITYLRFVFLDQQNGKSSGK